MATSVGRPPNFRISNAKVPPSYHCGSCCYAPLGTHGNNAIRHALVDRCGQLRQTLHRNLLGDSIKSVTGQADDRAILRNDRAAHKRPRKRANAQGNICTADALFANRSFQSWWLNDSAKAKILSEGTTKQIIKLMSDFKTQARMTDKEGKPCTQITEFLGECKVQ